MSDYIVATLRLACFFWNEGERTGWVVARVASAQASMALERAVESAALSRFTGGHVSVMPTSL